MSMQVERTVAYVTWRLLMGRRRWLLVLFANALPVFVSWLFMMETTQREMAPRFFVEMMVATVLTVLLPLSGLVHGTSAFGTELDDGTLRYILAKPVARWRIVLAKLVTAAAATLASALPGVLIAGTIVFGTPLHELVQGFAAAVLLASVLYAGLFLLFSLATRRALILGLLYVIVWEGALSRMFAGTRALSIREYSTSVVQAVSGGGGVLKDGMAMSTALPLAAAMLAATVTFAIFRLRVIEVVEEV